MIEELMIAYPKSSIVIIAVLVTFAMTLVTKHFTDQNRMKELKKLQKACQIKLKDNKGNPKKQAEIQKEMMECTMEMMKHSFKPLFITFIPLILLLGWIRGVYLESAIASTWLWWYIGAGVASSLILRKVMDVA